MFFFLLLVLSFFLSVGNFCSSRPLLDSFITFYFNINEMGIPASPSPFKTNSTSQPDETTQLNRPLSGVSNFVGISSFAGTLIHCRCGESCTINTIQTGVAERRRLCRCYRNRRHNLLDSLIYKQSLMKFLVFINNTLRHCGLGNGVCRRLASASPVRKPVERRRRRRRRDAQTTNYGLALKRISNKMLR